MAGQAIMLANSERLDANLRRFDKMGVSLF
jgi:hypothetical protein